jgi:hypothetical protein
LSKAGTQQAKIINEAIDLLTATVKVFPSRYETLHLQCDPLRGTDYDGNVRSGISDPTPSNAFALSPHHIRKESIRQHLVLVIHEARTLYQLVNGIDSDLDTGALALLHRCTGGDVGDTRGQSWTRPECTNILGEQSTTKLCDACRQRRDEWRRKPENQAA